jgi:lysophospholipase L1-like esterase
MPYDPAVPFRSTSGTVLTSVGVIAIAAAAVVWSSPPGVVWLPAIATMLGILGLVAAVWGGLSGWVVHRRDDHRWLQTARSTSLVVSILAIGLAVRASMDLQSGIQVSTDMVQPAPELGPGGMVLKPNLRQAKTVAPDRPHHPDDVSTPDRLQRFKRVRTFYTNTGPRGLRGHGFQSPAPGFRIVCIGDSVTFGWGVADDATYPAQLGRILGIDVVNAGMPAAKPGHMAKWLQLYARMVDPDLVVFAARPNWDLPNPFQDYQHAIDMAESAIAPAKLAIVLPPISTFDPLGVRESKNEVEQLRRVLGGRPMLELTDAFRAGQTGPGVVMETDGEQQRMVRLPDRAVVAFGTGSGDHLAPELIAAFESDPNLVEPLFFDGGHPDQDGYRLFAAEVGRFLRANGLVSQR